MTKTQIYAYTPRMDQSELRQILAAGETFTVEFKAEPINDGDLVEAVACLANGNGGTLLVGVDDDGTVVGAKPRHDTKTEPRRVEALIANRTEPPVSTTCTVAEIGGREIIVIEVRIPGNVVAMSDGRYVYRALDVHGRPQCLPMRPHDVLGRAGSLGVLDYSRVAVPGVTLDDLSATEFDRYREIVEANRGDEVLGSLSDADLLRALNLVTADDQLTVGSLLLFGKAAMIGRHVPGYEVGFQHLDGLEVRASQTGPLPLLRAMVEITDRVQARNPEEELDIGMFRVPLPRFAEVTIRELIANALVHRDYTAQGPTIVEVSQDALEVSNPGGFPVGVTASNLLTTPPRPRNPALADAFKRAGIVDRIGRGVNRAFAGQLAMGRPAPDYSRSNPHSVVARVRSGPADKELAGFLDEERRNGQVFSLEDLLALHEIRLERSITEAKAAELFQGDPQEARTKLNRLADKGLVEIRSERRGQAYSFSTSTYSRLAVSPGQMQARGLDKAEQEQRVLAHVDRHGSITRRQASDLCGLDSERASRLLRRLRDEGKLDLQGTKRAAHYVKPSAP